MSHQGKPVRRYPATRYQPPPLVDLGSREARERLSPAALKAFFNTMTRWKVRDEDARALLGGVTNGPFYEMKRNPARTLDADRLTRISYVIGIFKALGVLHSEPLADAWIQRPNSNPLFAGLTPLEYMIRGGLPAMQNVRRLLDARRAG
ncbi:MAG TPA: antitoxin Xre/MbcA/ParS toxin-binding domain-containing protein [Vicinamibacterales bacterium]|nr:antitoxin Xre/MbcA/ParS toxin-binding domain-containing protein [Vicinamibacterales bacterium]